MRRTVLTLLLCLLACAGLTACGEGEPAEDAVEAQERNVVALDGLRYRVVLFRQLNPSIAPDEALYDGPPAEAGSGLYAAFVEVCNEGAAAARTTGDVHLEDAFGQSFAPRPRRVPAAFAYRSIELDPGECLPRRDSSAERTFDGAALVFEVPFRSIRERPMTLELQGRGTSEPERIELDV